MKNYNAEMLFLALLNIPRVGRRTAYKFFMSLNDKIQNEDDLLNSINLYKNNSKKFPDVSRYLLKEAFSKAYKIIENSNDLGIGVISINSEDYPKKLKYIEDPPLVLFTKGNISALKNERHVAVIGKREPSKYGFNSAFEIGSKLAKTSTIVSGLALGCDLQAHKGCLDQNGIGIGVLAHGLDEIYPSLSKNVSEKLIENGGLLISEYPIKTNATKYNFIERDRIQSGISDIVFVIETNQEGGTMHTVKHSLKQNRVLVCLEFPEEAYFQGYAQGNKTLIQKKHALPFSISNDNLDQFIDSLKIQNDQKIKVNINTSSDQGSFEF